MDTRDRESHNDCPPQIRHEHTRPEDLPVSWRKAVVRLCPLTHVHGRHERVSSTGKNEEHSPVALLGYSLDEVRYATPLLFPVSRPLKEFESEPILFCPVVEEKVEIANESRECGHDETACHRSQPRYYCGVEGIVENKLLSPLEAMAHSHNADP